MILFGPLVDALYEKLCEEVPYKFVQCKPGQFISLLIHFLISLLLALIISKLKADENARHNRIKGMEVGIEVENIPLISS